MTVAENISLMLGFPRRFGIIDWNAARTRAERALEVVGADIDPEVRVHDLTRTEKSLVAIARALAADAEILVLDEPTASLPANEVARLFIALRRLRARGVGMIYVSHRLDEVFEIADRMVILRDGRVVGERVVSETSPEEAILLIVGREPSQVFKRPARHEGAARLVFEQVTIESCRSARLPDPIGRSGRFRGPARGRAGMRRPCPVRPCARHRRTNPARRPRDCAVVSARGDRIWASTWCAPIASRNRSCRDCRSGRTCSSIRWPPAARSSRIVAPRPRVARRIRAGRTHRAEAERLLAANRMAVGRQSAEGRGRPLAASQRPASTCSRIRPPASTSAPRQKSTGCSMSCSNAARRFSSCRPTSKRSRNLPPRAGVRSRARGRGAGGRRTRRGEPAGGGLGQRRTGTAGTQCDP